MARQFIYHMAGLNKAYGTKKVLENVHLSFYPDAKIGILGPNGSGKSTVLRSWPASTRNTPAKPGSPRARPSATCAQEPQLDPSKTVFENVMEGVAKKTAILERYNELMMNYSDETADEGGQAPGRDRQPEPLGPRTAGRDGDGSAALPARRLPTSPTCRAARSAASRSASCCCRQPDLLLLDEPTNHLDAETIAWLEKHLRDYPGSVLIITHDRYFLDNVTGWILELDRGRGIPYEGNYTAYLEAKAKRLQQEGREDDARQKAICARARVDRVQPQGPPDQVEGPHQGL